MNTPEKLTQEARPRVNACNRSRFLHNRERPGYGWRVGCRLHAGHESACQFPELPPPPTPGPRAVSVPCSGVAHPEEAAEAVGYCRCGVAVCLACATRHHKHLGHTWVPL